MQNIARPTLFTPCDITNWQKYNCLIASEEVPEDMEKLGPYETTVNRRRMP